MFVNVKLKYHIFISVRLGEVNKGFTRRETGKELCYKVNIISIRILKARANINRIRQY